eukprot:gene2757-3386_t
MPPCRVASLETTSGCPCISACFPTPPCNALSSNRAARPLDAAARRPTVPAHALPACRPTPACLAMLGPPKNSILHRKKKPSHGNTENIDAEWHREQARLEARQNRWAEQEDQRRRWIEPALAEKHHLQEQTRADMEHQLVQKQQQRLADKVEDAALASYYAEYVATCNQPSVVVAACSPSAPKP